VSRLPVAREPLPLIVYAELDGDFTRPIAGLTLLEITDDIKAILVIAESIAVWALIARNLVIF